MKPVVCPGVDHQLESLALKLNRDKGHAGTLDNG